MKKAFLLYGMTPRTAAPLREAFLRSGCVVKDVSGHSYRDILTIHHMLESKGFSPTLYMRTQPMLMTESAIRTAVTVGMLKQGLARDLVEVLSVSDAEATRAVKQHARGLMEAGEPPKVKQPSEVDRMKTAQKRDLLLTKQRQSNELLAAQQRELTKKAREDQQKMSAKGSGPKT